jgi:hypothetical protein
MPEAIVLETRLSVSMSGGSIRKTELEDQFVVGSHILYLYLTPAQAAQWVEVLTEHAKQVTA